MSVCVYMNTAGASPGGILTPGQLNHKKKIYPSSSLVINRGWWDIALKKRLQSWGGGRIDAEPIVYALDKCEAKEREEYPHHLTSHHSKTGAALYRLYPLFSIL